MNNEMNAKLIAIFGPNYIYSKVVKYFKIAGAKIIDYSNNTITYQFTDLSILIVNK